MSNIFKTFFLLFLMTILLMWVGEMVGGPRGMMLALGVAAVMNWVSYYFSDRIVLKLYKAREPEAGERRAAALVENLAAQANLPSPRVMVVDNPVPNAFATGRNPQHAVVAVTTGILEALNDRELSAVLAHELSHVKNRDILTGAVVATMAGAITMIARLAFWFGDRGRNIVASLAMLILAPLAAMIIQMAVSRSREFAADRSAGILTNRPMDLVAALEKIQGSVSRRPMPESAGSNITAHLFIINPFTRQGLASLFSTHPSLDKRAKRLQDLDQELRGMVKGI